ncbi:MAG TPA: hypothetical protein PLI57_07530 [Spirochaetota bacterium]|nr:hypothetical protein [Spirochaetota bacterium]
MCQFFIEERCVSYALFFSTFQSAEVTLSENICFICVSFYATIVARYRRDAYVSKN